MVTGSVGAGGCILVLEAPGVPVKWAKFRCGFEVCWVGYEMGLRDWTLGSQRLVLDGSSIG